MSEPVIGIVGGMGPEATVELMRRIIAATPATDDVDHIRMLVDNNPKIPSRIRALIEGTGEDPGPAIAAVARNLERAGADFLVIPCNTAHHYWSCAAEAVRIPVWHLPDLTLARVADSAGAGATIGLLASPALRQLKLYESRRATRPVDGGGVLYPEREDALLQVIRAVKANRASDVEIALLNEAARQLEQAGADVLVLGCTEYSLIGDRLESRVPVLDSLQVLAEEIVTVIKGGKSVSREIRE